MTSSTSDHLTEERSNSYRENCFLPSPSPSTNLPAQFIKKSEPSDVVIPLSNAVSSSFEKQDNRYWTSF